MFHLDIDCLSNGAPHQNAVASFMSKVAQLPPGPESHALRTLIAWELFQRTELMQAEDNGSVQQFMDLLAELGDAMVRQQASQKKFSHKLMFEAASDVAGDFKANTADHYGNLFKDFDDHHYYEEAAQLLKQRLERNGIDLGDIRNQKALDAGCGGGRYSVALRLLGFGEVTGVDFSEKNIETATQRANKRQLNHLTFKRGDVLDLPFDDESFDFVFSNGVIHHTESIPRGVAEISRVMKTGGTGWLYIIEKPGGLHWDMVEILRNVMQPVDKAYARAMFRMLGVPSNRVFYMLDHVMVPINTRLTPTETEHVLQENGLRVLQRLERGTDFDRAERIHSLKKTLPHKDIEWKWGVGENRYLFTKL